jgi:hypothetical protein
LPKVDYCSFDLTHCTDNLQNCDETELDCGGSCGPCETPGIVGRVVQFVGSGWLFTLLLLLIIVAYIAYRIGKSVMAASDKPKDEEENKKTE